MPRVEGHHPDRHNQSAQDLRALGMQNYLGGNPMPPAVEGPRIGASVGGDKDRLRGYPGLRARPDETVSRTLDVGDPAGLLGGISLPPRRVYGSYRVTKIRLASLDTLEDTARTTDNARFWYALTGSL